MTTINRGAANTLSVEWRQYAGGPYVAMTGVTITITPLAGGAATLATTSVGITNPATGIYAYVWTPAADLTTGQYLVEWSGTDPQADVVGAAELVEVVAGAALGGPYASAAELKRRMSIPDSATVQDTDIADALLSASDAINRWTHRQFGQDTEVSARSYASGPSGVDVDDFWTTDDLLVSGVAWDLVSTDWALEPVNGVVDGVPGWPYNRLTAYAPGQLFLLSWPTDSTVVVSAKWGWAEVPAGVKAACLMLAADDLKSKDAPFGVAGFGDYVVRIRSNPKVAEKLAPYVRTPVLVA